MIILPEKFKESIVNRYNKDGIEWLNNIDKLIKKYTDKYKLEDIRLVNQLTMNLIFLAKSREYGDVVLKITPGTTVISEVSALQHYNSKYSAICYDYDKEDKVILLLRKSYGIAIVNMMKKLYLHILIFVIIYIKYIITLKNEVSNYFMT